MAEVEGEKLESSLKPKGMELREPRFTAEKVCSTEYTKNIEIVIF